MSDVFDVREKYFSDEQLKHIEQFVQVCPESKTFVTNAKGQNRRVRSVSLPTGTVTPKTWRFHEKEQDAKEKPHMYHTPAAILSQRTALIAFEDMATGKKATCNSLDWIQWLGDKYTVKPAKGPTIEIPVSFAKQIEKEAVKAKEEQETKTKGKTKEEMAKDGASGKATD